MRDALARVAGRTRQAERLRAVKGDAVAHFASAVAMCTRERRLLRRLGFRGVTCKRSSVSAMH